MITDDTNLFDFLNNLDCRNRYIRETVTEQQVKVNSSLSSVNLVVNEFDLSSSAPKLIDKYASVMSPHNITKSTTVSTIKQIQRAMLLCSLNLDNFQGRN